MPATPRRSDPLIQAYPSFPDQPDKRTKRKRSVENSGPTRSGDQQRPRKIQKSEGKRPGRLDTLEASPSVERESQKEMAKKLEQLITHQQKQDDKINNLRVNLEAAMKAKKRDRRDLDLARRRNLAGLGRQDEMQNDARKKQDKLENLSTTTQELNTNITTFSKKVNDDFVTKQMLDTKLEECRQQTRGDFERTLEERAKEFPAQHEAKTAEAEREARESSDVRIQELEDALESSESKVLGLETQINSNREKHELLPKEKSSLSDSVDSLAGQINTMDARRGDTLRSCKTRLSKLEILIKGSPECGSEPDNASQSQFDAALPIGDAANGAAAVVNSVPGLLQKFDDLSAQLTKLQLTKGKVDTYARQLTAVANDVHDLKASNEKNFKDHEDGLLQNAGTGLATQKACDENGIHITALQTRMDVLGCGLHNGSEGGNDCDPVQIDSFERGVKQIRHGIHRLEDSDTRQWREIGLLKKQIVPNPHASSPPQQGMTRQQWIPPQLPPISDIERRDHQGHFMQPSWPEPPSNGRQRDGTRIATPPQTAAPNSSQRMCHEHSTDVEPTNPAKTTVISLGKSRCITETLRDLHDRTSVNENQVQQLVVRTQLDIQNANLLGTDVQRAYVERVLGNNLASVASRLQHLINHLCSRGVLRGTDLENEFIARQNQQVSRQGPPVHTAASPHSQQPQVFRANPQSQHSIHPGPVKPPALRSQQFPQLPSQGQTIQQQGYLPQIVQSSSHSSFPSQSRDQHQVQDTLHYDPQKGQRHGFAPAQGPQSQPGPRPGDRQAPHPSSQIWNQLRSPRSHTDRRLAPNIAPSPHLAALHQQVIKTPNSPAEGPHGLPTAEW